MSDMRSRVGEIVLQRMYTRGASKIATRAALRARPQQLDILDRELGKRESVGPFVQGVDDMSSQRPVFNGKKAGLHRANSDNNGTSPEPLTPQHEENVKFVLDAWNQVQRELEACKNKDGGTIYYRERTPVQMKDFQPFDLENWWGNRTFQKIKQNA